MKKYIKSGFNTTQDIKLEAGTYSLVAYVKSLYGNTYTFALGHDGAQGVEWTEYDVDVVKNQLCKVWFTFTIREKITKLKPISSSFSASLPVYVADLQLTRGNVPVESGASPFDFDEIINDLHDEIDSIEDFTNEAFKDGILNREEKTQLRASLDAVGVIVESVRGSYDKLKVNPFINQDRMADINRTYNDFMVAWINSNFDPKNPYDVTNKGGLKDIIDWIVKGDHIVDENERAEKDRALEAFNDALYAYNLAEKNIYEDIGDEIEDVQNEINSLEDFTNKAFEDGIIDRAEAKAIEKYINTVNESFESVKSTYDKMLLNSLLITAEKAKLTGKYTPLSTAKGNLITSITTAIADGVATKAEKADVDTKFGLYNTAMKAYQTALEEARIAMDVELKRLADAKVDEAIIKATYWSIKATTPVIYKDANSATASGVHTPVTVSGELRSGTTTTQGGFISIQPNGGTETTATASPRTIAPTNAEGKTSYTVRLYNTASKTTLLDTMTIPVVFKGASGVNAINVSLSNEADVLPASATGVVSDYTGSGTIIRVFEGATELAYGTGNGQFQVSASGSGITVGSASTSGKTRVYGKASNMTSDNATITFTISGKTAAGASFSLTKVQTFAKSRVGQKGEDGKDGYFVSLSKENHTYTYDKNNNLKGVLSNGATTISVQRGDIFFKCDTTSIGVTPVANNTYRVVAIAVDGVSYSGASRTLVNDELKIWPSAFAGETGSMTFTIRAMSDGVVSKDFKKIISFSKNRDGEDGLPPEIDTTITQYALGESKTEHPTLGWVNNRTMLVPNEDTPYEWSRQRITYKDSTQVIYVGYVLITNISPMTYFFGEWDCRVKYTRSEKSYPIVNHLRGTGNKPLYYYPKNEGIIEYIWFIKPNVNSPSTWYKQNDLVLYENDGSNGDPVCPLGIFKSKYNDNKELPSVSTWWENVTAKYAPNGIEGQKLWEFADGVELIITEAIMANFAKLDSFVFNDGKMFSQEGTLRGDPNSVEYTDDDHEPNFEVDGRSGRVKMKDAEVDGIITATSGSFTGALASPFERTKSTYTKDFSNNLIITGSTFTLPWNQLGSGRLIRLIQPNPGKPYCTAPTGKYFYEDGEQKNRLTMLGAEIIELLGYTDSQGNFTGWLVLNRGLLHTVSTWGEPHRIVAHGHVRTNYTLKYHTFDGSTLTTSTSEFNSRKYTSIVMPSKWFDSVDGYYVKIIANGGDSAAFHTVTKHTNYTFAVYQHSLNASNWTLSPTTTFDFYFEIYSAAWIYPKADAVAVVMPGEPW